MKTVLMKQTVVASPKAGVNLTFGEGGVYPIDGGNMTEALAAKLAADGVAEIAGEDDAPAAAAPKAAEPAVTAAAETETKA